MGKKIKPWLNYKEQLIYELLFSEKDEFDIKLKEYTNEYNAADFFINIKNVLHKGGVKIISERLDKIGEDKIWHLNLKRFGGSL